MRPSSNSPFPSPSTIDPETPASLQPAMTGGKPGLWEWDIVTNELKWSDAVYRIHGVDPATFKVTWENFTKLVHPDDRARVQTALQHTLEHNAPYELEFRICRPGGNEARIFTNATVARLNGRPCRLSGATLDITARQQADDASRWLAAIVDSSDDAIISKDLNSIITSWNAGAQRLFGYTAREAIGRTVTILIPAGRKDEEIGVLQRIRRGERIDHFETVRERKDGTFVDVSLTVSPVKDAAGRIVGASKIVRDISERKKTLEALRLSEERFRLLASNAPVGIFLSEPSGGCVFVNERWCEMTSLSQGQAQGREWVNVLHPEDRERVLAEWRQVMEHGRPAASEFRFQRADGRTVWVRGSVVPHPIPLFGAEGHSSGLLNVIVDVTAERTAQQAVQQRERQLQLVADHAPIFLAHCDREHRFNFVNLPYAQRYGRQREDIIGRHVSELTGPEAYATFQQHMDATLAGRRTEFEQEIPYATLGPRWVHVICEPERTAQGEVVGLVAVIVDITLRKQAERELERARDDALAAARAKDDFLAALSHELRTPLNPVLLLASDASNNASLPREIRDSFELIRHNVSLEARLIDDLLDLTRITQGKLQIEKQRVDLHAVLRATVASLRAEIDHKRLNLQLFLGTQPAGVMGDSIRLQQLLGNILQNAVKFTPAGGQVCVVTRVPAGGELITIEITDNGIGMSPAELAGVFETFTRGEHAGGNGTHRFGGLGMGLAIARSLVEMHDGRIHAASPGRNRGSVFVVELPLAATGARGKTITGPRGIEPALQDDVPASSPGSILLVEDHASTRETLQKLLSRRNYEVVPAGSVAEALAHASARPFDFLVSDVGLPDGDGYQLMAELRRIQPALPGIALSGYGMEDDLQRSHAGGFSSHLVKPVSIVSLERALCGLTKSVAPVIPT